jgi:23S rRNA (pseudouridine1915-N3)-methyltransferase
MPEINIIAAGKLRNGPLKDLMQDYTERIRWPLTIQEIEAKSKSPKEQHAEENTKILSAIEKTDYIIALDQRGREITSNDFAKKIDNLQNNGIRKLSFVIGGSEGLTEEVRSRADILVSFGRQTWPHMLARIMLLEQIYRAQQILAGHPYHK